MQIHQEMERAYSSIGKRSLEKLCRVKINAPLEVHSVISRTKSDLEKLAKSGNPLAFCRKSLFVTLLSLERSKEFQSVSASHPFNLPYAAIKQRYGLEMSAEEFFRSKNVSEFLAAHLEAYVFSFHFENENKKKFVYRSDPNSPLVSLLSNVHECIHLLQDAEEKELIEAANSFLSIPGMKDFHHKIQKSHSNLFADCVTSTHFLNFYTLPKIKKLAKEAKIDMNQYESELSRSLIKFNFYSSLREGEAYLEAGKVLSLVMDDKELSECIGLLQALIACNGNRLSRIYYSGIGLYELTSLGTEMNSDFLRKFSSFVNTCDVATK